MFKISQSESYSWPVTVEYPVSGNKFQKDTFDAEFKRLSQSRTKELLLAEEDPDAYVRVCKEVLVGWKGIVDANGEELPFSESARDRLLDVQLVAGAIVKSFLDSLSGDKAKRKN